MLLTSIIVKALAVADVFLGYFATSTAVSQVNICGTIWTTHSGQVTDCGRAHIVAELMTDLFQLHMMVDVLPALFAV